MIFATVGTHEDPFDRLLQGLDQLVETGVIREPVFMQSGSCTYAAKHVQTAAMMPYDELQARMAAARIVVCAAGPATIMQVYAHGKVPIVVPRRPEFGEHVDGHQVAFARRMADRVLLVVDIEELGPAIQGYEERVRRIPTTSFGPERAAQFAARFEGLCEEVLARPGRRARPWFGGR